MANHDPVFKNELRILFDEYIKECEFSSQLRPATLRGYRAVFQLFLEIMPEINTAQFLSSSYIIDFFSRLQTRKRIAGKDIVKVGVKASTVKTYWNKLNSFFEWLHRNKHIKQNPLNGIKRPPEPKYEDSKALKDSEVDRIIASIITGTKHPLAIRRDIAMISLLLYCGLRRGELISLQIKDIDILKAEITIRGETSKSKRTRILPMHPTLVSHIKDYLGERKGKGFKTEFLLVSTNKGDAPLTRNGLHHWEKRLVKLSGVRLHLHRFRHTFATNLARKDVGIVKIQKLLGHKSISMTERYVRSILPEELYEDISRL